MNTTIIDVLIENITTDHQLLEKADTKLSMLKKKKEKSSTESKITNVIFL